MKPIIALLLFMGSAFAELKPIATYDTLVTKDGKTFTKVIVTDKNPAAISIRHENGATRIPLENLTAEVAKAFPYDAKLAKEFKERDAILQKQLEAAMNAPISKEEVQKSIEREIDRAQIPPEEKAKRRQLLIKKLDSSRLQSAKGIR